MKQLSHGRLLKLSFGSLSPLKWVEETKFCRLPQGSCRYVHTQFTKQLTDDEEEELVSSLVQDAFNPSKTARMHLSPEPQLGGICQNLISANLTLSEDGNGKKIQESATNGCLGSLDVMKTEETDSRTVNKPYEIFARVRLSSHAYTVEELRNISNREANLEWMCMHCQRFNFMGRKTCRQCGVSQVKSHRERHPPTRHVVSFPTNWICEGCCHLNNTADAIDRKLTHISPSPFEMLSRSTMQKHRAKFFCSQCSKSFAGVREWYCPYCDHVNSKASMQCATCLADRPVVWKCGGCEHTLNSIFSTVCYMCKKCRPMKVSNSTVLCPGCGVRNDCRWELCEACMSPLPVMIETVGSAKPVHQAALIPGRFPPQSMDLVPAPPEQRASERPRGTPKIYLDERGTAELPMASAATPHRSSLTSDTNGSWWCIQCNIIQRRNATFCDVCLRPRHLAKEASLLSNGVKSIRGNEAEECDKGGQSTCEPLKLPPMGSWQCPYCRQFKDAKVSRCCGKNREIRKGYWLCQKCSSVNRSEREVCIGCGMSPALAEEQWTCVVCEFENEKDNLLCQVCGTEHAFLWRCASCHLAVPQSQVVCPTCLATKPEVPAPIVCPVCQASNLSVRLACFRCRARLQHPWRCPRCDATHEDRALLRCPACHEPHHFNEAEETWVCELCASAIASGGDLPVRQQCPKCHADRVPGGLSFPSRWRCPPCGIFNRTANPQCMGCGGARLMPDDFHVIVTCPNCFGKTDANAKEKCTNCGFSLSDMLTVAASEVHMSPALTAHSLLDTSPRENSACHQTTEIDVDAALLSCENKSFHEVLKQENLDDSAPSNDKISFVHL
ncbi:unnamed protein product [Phytomonas sp. Hart1]|nr:unnamed protein product [Phytomonas sp. Hart1]|eukprot:CCW67015.1 unnamed protein product [Phytomonas sp. isolate Hart1]